MIFFSHLYRCYRSSIDHCIETGNHRNYGHRILTQPAQNVKDFGHTSGIISEMMNAWIKIESIIIIALKLFISRLTAHRFEHTAFQTCTLYVNVKPRITQHIRASLLELHCVLQYNGDACVHNHCFIGNTSFKHVSYQYYCIEC